MTLEALERELLRALLAGHHPVLETLRAQSAAASVKERERTPTGFFTYFDVPRDVRPAPREIEVIGDLQIELEGAATPADAILHLRGGRLHALECYVYDGPFPEQPVIRSALYYGTAKFPAITDELLAARDVEAALEQ